MKNYEIHHVLHLHLAYTLNKSSTSHTGIEQNGPVPTRLLRSFFHIQLLLHKIWIESRDKTSE